MLNPMWELGWHLQPELLHWSGHISSWNVQQCEQTEWLAQTHDSSWPINVNHTTEMLNHSIAREVEVTIRICRMNAHGQLIADPCNMWWWQISEQFGQNRGRLCRLTSQTTFPNVELNKQTWIYRSQGRITEEWNVWSIQVNRQKWIISSKWIARNESYLILILWKS